MRLDDVTLRSFGETILSYPGEGRGGREGGSDIDKKAIEGRFAKRAVSHRVYRILMEKQNFCFSKHRCAATRLFIEENSRLYIPLEFARIGSRVARDPAMRFRTYSERGIETEKSVCHL